MQAAVVAQISPSPGDAGRFVRLERLAHEVLDLIRSANDGQLTGYDDMDMLVWTLKIERDLEGAKTVLMRTGPQQ
jgi:hypothetical protein